MRKNFLQIFLFSLIILVTLGLFGCLNYEQTMTLKSDGSGSLKIHYWAKESNTSSITKVSFEEKEIKDNQYAPELVKSVKVETDKDTLKHVYVELEFKDVKNLGKTKGFKDNVFELKSEGGLMVYTHTVKKDTTAVSGDYKLNYEVIFPDKPEKVDAKGKIDGNKVKWENKLEDISKADLVMTASFKGASGSMTFVIIGIVVVVVIIIIVVMMRKKPAPAA